jgi:hypothetical protein
MGIVEEYGARGSWGLMMVMGVIRTETYLSWGLEETHHRDGTSSDERGEWGDDRIGVPMPDRWA